MLMHDASINHSHPLASTSTTLQIRKADHQQWSPCLNHIHPTDWKKSEILQGGSKIEYQTHLWNWYHSFLPSWLALRKSWKYIQGKRKKARTQSHMCLSVSNQVSVHKPKKLKTSPKVMLFVCSNRSYANSHFMKLIIIFWAGNWNATKNRNYRLQEEFLNFHALIRGT